MHISFVSLSLGLLSGLVVWLFGWAAQTFGMQPQMAAGWTMGPQKGITSALLVFCLFIVMYLTAKYAAALGHGKMLAIVVCYAVMVLLVAWGMSYLQGSGFTAAAWTPANGSLSTGSVVSASWMRDAVPGGVAMLVGAICCAKADRLMPSERVKGALLYAAATVLLVIASACITVMMMNQGVSVWSW